MRHQLLAGAFIYVLSSMCVPSPDALADPPDAGQAPAAPPAGPPPSTQAQQAGGDGGALPLMPLPVEVGTLVPSTTPLPDVPPISPDPASHPAPQPAAPPPAQPIVTTPVPAAVALRLPPPLPHPVIQVVRARDDMPQAQHLAGSVLLSAPGTVYLTPRGAASTFQGRVTGIPSLSGVQVGIVSLKGRPWTNPANFQWGAAQNDGSFQIRADRDPAAPKTLVVAAPGHPWTYARWDFAGQESAKDITIDIAPARHVTVTASGPGLTPSTTLTVEVFDARDYRMPGDRPLTHQRLAIFTGPASGVAADLTAEPVGLYVSAPGMAAYYQIVDPAKADGFEFQLLREGAVDITVQRDGQPAAGVAVLTGCPDAPFSWRQRTSDTAGHIQIGGLPPGEYRITADGGETTLRVQSGQTSQTTLSLSPAAR